LISLNKKTVLNKLVARCTIAVIPIADSIGKVIPNTGIRTLPKPNPEKNVITDATNVTITIIILSINEDKCKSISIEFQKKACKQYTGFTKYKE